MSRKGVPNFEATDAERQLVRNLVAVGVAQAQIACVILRPGADGAMTPISEDTLQRHFRLELDTGSAVVHAALAGRMLRTALGHNASATVKDELRAQMFLLKTKFGYREVNQIDLGIPDDADDADVLNVTTRIAGLLERGRRRQSAGTTH